jgi:hypothetical protein
LDSIKPDRPESDLGVESRPTVRDEPSQAAFPENTKTETAIPKIDNFFMRKKTPPWSETIRLTDLACGKKFFVFPAIIRLAGIR